MKKWLYYILKEDGRSGHVVNDVVTYSGQPKPLPQTPNGWQDLLLNFERELTKHGLVTTVSLPVGLVRDAARIARDAIYKETIETIRQLLIQRHTFLITGAIPGGTFNNFYKYFFRGEIDFAQSEDTQDMFNVPVTEGGLKKLFKANEKTVYEFPMNDPLCVNLKMDGIALDKKGNFIVVDGFEIDNTNYGDSSFAPFSLINAEGSAAGIAFFAQSIENTAGVAFADRLLSPNFFAKAAGNVGTINMHIIGKIVYTCTEQDAANGFRMRFLTSTQTVVNQNDYDLFTDTPLVANQSYSHDIDITIPLIANERAYLEMILGNTGTDTKIQFSPDSKLSVEYSFTYPATYVKCYRLIDLYKKLCGKVFNDELVAVSALCEQFSNLLITCGDAIRGIETATLKTSLADFFKFVDSVLMAGMNITQSTVEIEDRVTYYTEADEIDLGTVRDFKIIPATDIMANTYKFGHQKQDIEDVNGKYDPNGNNQFEGPIKKITQEYNMVSQYKAGPYEIEILRINFEGKTTTDDNSDNDVFAIAAVEQDDLVAEVSFLAVFNGMIVSNPERFRAGQKIRITGSTLNDGVYDILSVNFLLLFSVITFAQPVVDEASVTITIEWLVGDSYLLDRPVYDTLEGVPHDSIFNLPYLTPKTMLFRHGRWLRSMNAGLDSQKIKFVSGKDNKNTELKTVLGSVVIDEDRDETIANLGDYLFLPWYFIFKTEVPIDLPELLEANPNRSYKFTDEYGQEWRGFLRQAGIAPNDYTPQEFRLLAAPSNDIELLIHG